MARGAVRVAESESVRAPIVRERDSATCDSGTIPSAFLVDLVRQPSSIGTF